MKIISWNLYYRRGAAASDIAAIIEQEKPDLFLMQEATRGIDSLPSHAGGHFTTLPWSGKSYNLAVWSQAEDVRVDAIELPETRLPTIFPQRLAQVVRVDGLTIANVHLSHGQLLNRRQLRAISQKVHGPLAIIGDFNALGPIVMRGFKDVGPRRVTHYAQRVVPLRLDRCVVRDLDCARAETMQRGASDHRPILLELSSRR